MQFEIRTIDYYIERINNGISFAFPGFSDAEWFCILSHDLGKKTGLGQLMTAETGQKLRRVLEDYRKDPDFLVAVPSCMWDLADFYNAGIPRRIEEFVSEIDYRLPFYERDIVTDHLAERGGLYPLISCLQNQRTIIIGNSALRGLDFLNYAGFIEIHGPNFHLDSAGISRVVQESKQNYAPCTVFVVCAGLSAALIISELWKEMPDCTFLDCGSIWDAFVGIGGQREWRARLYANPEDLGYWKKRNLMGYV
ncbi:MAG: hypothetical protein WC455_11270 [Dehalococcoidia bacterium]|jgi:hypothetical protein